MLFRMDWMSPTITSLSITLNGSGGDPSAVAIPIIMMGTMIMRHMLTEEKTILCVVCCSEKNNPINAIPPIVQQKVHNISRHPIRIRYTGQQHLIRYLQSPETLFLR